MALMYVDDLTITVENTFHNKTSTIKNNLKDFDEWASRQHEQIESQSQKVYVH